MSDATAPSATPERDLWATVVLQALNDATSTATDRVAAYARAAARTWLLEGGRDLTAVCELAGIEPGYLRLRAELMAASGWRRP